MILIAELQMQGDKHVHVNSGLLKIVQLSFNTHTIKVFCDKKHKNELIKHIELPRFQFITFKYVEIKEINKISTLYKTIRETVLAYKIFTIAKHTNAEIIIFASAFPFTALFLNAFAKLFRQKIIICLHGDIGVLSLSGNIRSTRYFRYAVKRFFETRSLNTIALFYGESIKNKLFKMFPTFEKRNIISIDHPYNYYDSHLKTENKEELIMMNIGTGLINKNSHYFYKIAEHHTNKFNNIRVKFIQIGKVSDEVISYSNQHVEIINSNKLIPFGIFEGHIKRADYFIYFFSENSMYDLCPSGTFFDAIKYQKPIISLKNTFFDYYFDRLGDIGYLCHSLDEMNDIINRILIQRDLQEYQNKVNTLKKASMLLSIDNIKQSFYHQYITLNSKTFSL